MSKRDLLFVVVWAGMVFGQVVSTRVDHLVLKFFSSINAGKIDSTVENL